MTRIIPRIVGAACLAALFAGPLLAQSAAAPGGAMAPRDKPWANVPVPARQIALAVTPLPANMRDSAAVLGYDPSGHLISLRKGTNGMICLADDPSDPKFHVSCYYKSLEPFMARGRELRAQGKNRAQIDSIRKADVRKGRYAMPSKPAALYQLFAPAQDSVDASGAVAHAEALYVMYIPFATTTTTGLGTNPVHNAPWLMDPGAPWAHVMVGP